MAIQARVYVTLKREVLDPQGDAVRRALGTLGFVADSVRVGKFIEISVDTEDRASAEHDLRAMCEKLLTNPVIEDFRFELD